MTIKLKLVHTLYPSMYCVHKCLLTSMDTQIQQKHKNSLYDYTIIKNTNQHNSNKISNKLQVFFLYYKQASTITEYRIINNNTITHNNQSQNIQ